MNFNLDSIGPTILTFVFGIGVVSAFLAKYLTKARKYVALASSLTGFINDFINAAEDDKVTEEEWHGLKNRYIQFIADLKK